jgi:phosphoserine aminotransferase
MLKWKTQADNDSLYNTPPAYGIYICGKVFKWIKAQGGLTEMKKRNEEKAAMLYDYLETTDFYKSGVQKDSRSMMNVVFRTGDDELDKKFVAASVEHGFTNLKGHRLVGGMRASIYNAMPKDGVEALIAFMKEFEKANR